MSGEDQHFSVLNEYNLDDVDYDENLITFWFVDLLTEAFHQLKSSADQQQVLVAWFDYIYKLIQDTQPCTQKELFAELRDVVLKSVQTLHIGVPMPPETCQGKIRDRSKTTLDSSQGPGTTFILEKSSGETRSSSKISKQSSVEKGSVSKTSKQSSAEIRSTHKTSKRSSVEASSTSKTSRQSGGTQSTNKTSKQSSVETGSRVAEGKISRQSSSKMGSIYRRGNQSSVQLGLSDYMANRINQATSQMGNRSTDLNSVPTPYDQMFRRTGEMESSSYYIKQAHRLNLEQMNEHMRKNSIATEINLRGFKTVMEILYSIFANPFCFSVIQNVLHTEESNSVIPFPFRIKLPMKLAPQQPALEKEKKTKSKEKSTPKQKKVKKTDKENKEEEKVTDEEKLQPDESLVSKEEFIQPLRAAVDDNFFNKLFQQELTASKEKNKKNKDKKKGGKKKGK